MVTLSGVGHTRTRYYYHWPFGLDHSGNCTEISQGEEVSEDDEKGCCMLTAHLEHLWMLVSNQRVVAWQLLPLSHLD